MRKPRRCPVYLGSDTIPRLLDFSAERALSKFALVADENTFAVLGERVEVALRAQGYDVLPVLLKGDDIMGDANAVMQVLYALDRAPRTFIAVGAGTITDIARFVSHRLRTEFVSLPTAPSNDGYTSPSSPMLMSSVKLSLACRSPLAVFADEATLCAAPQPLLAAGFGDMLAKLTSVADWELGALLWDEPYDAEIAQRARLAAWNCAALVETIARAEPSGIRVLMEALIEAGWCMQDFGETRPASGYEHHVSHFWEGKMLREGRRPALHGAKVGIATVHSMCRYEQLRAISRSEARERLQWAERPEAQIESVRRAFGPQAEHFIAAQKPFLEMTEARRMALTDRVLSQWAEIQRVAGTVPPAAEMAGWLRAVGGPVTGREIGLSDDEIALGLRNAHYYRDRFTVAKLSYFLGLELADCPEAGTRTGGRIPM